MTAYISILFSGLFADVRILQKPEGVSIWMDFMGAVPPPAGNEDSWDRQESGKEENGPAGS